MENQNISKQDCGCSDGSCCTPQKKSSPWKKWIFIVIILAAAAIATVKIVQVKSVKDKPVPEKCCDNPNDKSCCPHSNK